jgi:hypothetical protein
MNKCGCGIPNKADWYVYAVIGRPHESGFGTETDYTDIYVCDEHFPGYPDGSMSEDDLRSLFAFDGADQWDVLEFHAWRLHLDR